MAYSAEDYNTQPSLQLGITMWLGLANEIWAKVVASLEGMSQLPFISFLISAD